MDCYIKQLRDNDCAFASLKMLMAYYSKNKDYLFLKQDLDRENYSLWDIIQIAKKYGIEIQGVKISDMRKRFTLDYQPFLALFKDSNNENGHLVFVRKIKKNKMLIFDPKKGKYWIKMARFYEKWSGIYLRVISYEPALYRAEDTKIVKRTGMIVGNIISALSSILLLIGFYFVKDDSYFIVPLIFVVGFVLCSILSNIFIKRSAFNFDKAVSTKVYKRENKNFIKKYEEILKYKTFVYTTPSTLITNILLILFFVTITCLNDLKNVVFFTILFVIGLLDYFASRKIHQHYSHKIEDMEIKLAKPDISEKDFVFNFQLLSRTTDKFATIILLRRYIIGFFVFALTFVLMAISRQVSLNYLIFNFLIYDIVYQYFQKCISYGENKEEYKWLKAKFVSLLRPSK